jgi:hypothetical protein
MSEPLPLTDAEFQARTGFCRTECGECDRLDEIDLKHLTPAEIRARGMALAATAIINGEGPL